MHRYGSVSITGRAEKVNRVAALNAWQRWRIMELQKESNSGKDESL